MPVKWNILHWKKKDVNTLYRDRARVHKTQMNGVSRWNQSPQWTEDLAPLGLIFSGSSPKVLI